MESKLLSQQSKASNKLMEMEFVEASDTVLPVTNDKLRRTLYREAEVYLRDKDGGREGVPIQRLARILDNRESGGCGALLDTVWRYSHLLKR